MGDYENCCIKKSVLFSIIVPVYKVERYLDVCINSILEQTYTNFELILVDDGSPDKCGEMCDLYSHKNGKIRVIHRENGGLSAARNSGLKEAVGEYIIFVDSDDMLHPQLLELSADEIERNGADIVAFRFQEVCDEDRDSKRDISPPISYKTVSAKQVKRDFYGFFPDVLSISAWSRVYKRKLFETMRFKEGIIYEDLQILPTLLDACDRISYTDTPLYYYRQTPNSIIRSDFSVKQFDMLWIEKNSIIPFIDKNATRENVNKAYDSYIDNYVYMHFMKYHKHLKGNPLDLSFALLYKRLVLCRWRKYMCSGGRRAIVSLLSLISIRWAYWFAKRCCKTMFAYLH